MIKVRAAEENRRNPYCKNGSVMQIFLTMASDQFALPINYRPLIHGAIYQVPQSDPAFSFALHNNEKQSAAHACELSWRSFSYSAN